VGEREKKIMDRTDVIIDPVASKTINPKTNDVMKANIEFSNLKLSRKKLKIIGYNGGKWVKILNPSASLMETP
jgi:hypothetical protein